MAKPSQDRPGSEVAMFISKILRTVQRIFQICEIAGLIKAHLQYLIKRSNFQLFPSGRVSNGSSVWFPNLEGGGERWQFVWTRGSQSRCGALGLGLESS